MKGLNEKIGLAAAGVLAGTVAVFFITLLLTLAGVGGKTVSLISYLDCILLSWAYVTTTACLTQGCPPEGRGAAEAARLFAVLYAMFVNLVYFTQATAVWYEMFPENLRVLFDFQVVGGWLFRLDIIGYGIMAVSTFFLGLSIAPAEKESRGLRRLLLFHGLFASCAGIALLPIFHDTGEVSNAGILALLAWCAYFFPTALLLCKRFRRQAPLDRAGGERV